MSNTLIPPAVKAAAQLDTRTGAYTVKDLSQMLQCSQRHIWRQIDLDAIPGKFLVGRLVRFSRTIVDAWLAGQH
jgi:excisionase family DNA binding protein